jgi:hypothetical protein
MNEAFPSLFDLRATHVELLAQQRKGTPFDSLAPEVTRFVVRARQTGAVLDAEEQRAAAQGLIDYWLTRLERTALPFEDGTLVDFDESLAPELPDDKCPYVGLEAFREKDRPNFFGRAETLARAMQIVRERRFLAVIGPSGSGKSSIVLGGVLPLLKEGAIEGSREWQYETPFEPGNASGKHLAAAAAAGATLVMVVDQLEELFTLVDDEASRLAFAKRLVDIHKAGGVVILTIREDYLHRLAALPELQELVRGGDLRATPLTASELREAIEKPAERVNLKFESGLVDKLVAGVVGEPAALPLLQFTLWRLWTKRRRNRLTLETYREVGGEVGGGRSALALAADEVFEGLKIVQNQDTMRRILLRMVKPGAHSETTSSRVFIADLLRLGDDPARVQDVLDKLLAARLIRRTNERVEVAHEALIRNWPKFVQWIEQKASAMTELHRFEALADEWVRFGRESGFLDERQLEEAEEWLRSDEAKEIGVKSSLPALVAASRAKIDGDKKRVRFAISLVTLLVAALLIAQTVLLIRLGMENDKYKAALDAAQKAEKKAKDESARANAATQKYEIVNTTLDAVELPPIESPSPPPQELNPMLRTTRVQREAAPPFAIGASIGSSGAVSACCVVFGRDGERYLLAMHLHADPGDRVYQPAPADGGTTPIGTVERVGKDPERSGALIRLDRGVRVEMVFGSAPVRGIAPRVRFGDKVRAFGRGSGLVEGTIVAVRGKDYLTTINVQSGDSGAPVVDVRNRLVGVVFGGLAKVSSVLPIEPLLRELDVTLKPAP